LPAHVKIAVGKGKLEFCCSQLQTYSKLICFLISNNFSQRVISAAQALGKYGKPLSNAGWLIHENMNGNKLLICQMSKM
jgi:hypothetical protein